MASGIPCGIVAITKGQTPVFRRSDRLRNTFSSSAKVSKPATDGPEVFWIRLHQRCAARWECISDRSDRFLGRHICLNLFSTGGISLSGQSTFWSQCGLAKGLAVESICGLASDKVLLIYPCSLLEHTRRAAPQRMPALGGTQDPGDPAKYNLASFGQVI